MAAWRTAGETVALVPTMGALHEGHLQLVRLAKARQPRVVSIFVNPTQFAPHEDFDRYPRDEAGDLAKLALVGCDLVWAPDRDEMYPEGFATRIVPAGAAEGLESDFRPDFFGGVATVCCKLFTQVAPDIAVFGEKDYQQLRVVRQMVRDLNLPLEIVALRPCANPTVSPCRAAIAISRRGPRDRTDHSPRHHRGRKGVAAGRGSGSRVAEGKQDARSGGFKVDYLEVRDAETLKAAAAWRAAPERVLVAAWLGKTRLIDNVAA